MKQILSQLIDDFLERTLPNPVPRAARFFEIKGKADVVTGMRRAGKNWFCYQKINQLLHDNIPLNQILYLNLEDERLLDSENIQWNMSQPKTGLKPTGRSYEIQS